MGMVALQPQLEERVCEQGEMRTCSLLGYYCKQASISFPQLQYPLLDCNTFNQAASYGNQIKLDDA